MRRCKSLEMDILVCEQARAAGWPKPATEYRFHPERKWRFDFAWVDALEKFPFELPIERTALEIQGGIWNRGKHGRGSGILKDYEKLNAAQALGWRVLQLTPQQVRAGELQTWLEKMR